MAQSCGFRSAAARWVGKPTLMVSLTVIGRGQPPRVDDLQMPGLRRGQSMHRVVVGDAETRVF